MKDKEYKVIESEGVACYAPKDIAKILSVSQAESYRIFRSVGFPSFKLGEKMLRVTKSDFNRWLDMKRGT